VLAAAALTLSASVENLYYDFGQIVNHSIMVARAHGLRAKSGFSLLGIPGVFSHVGKLVEHPELVADRIFSLPHSLAEKLSSPESTTAWATASIYKSPGPSRARSAMARRPRARSCGVEFKSACAR
jgi:hypothetical protein